VCRDAQGNPVTNAQVTWHNDDNGRNFNLKTNKKGEYFSLGLDPGKYTVTLTKDGKVLDSVKNYPLGVDEVSLDFDLKKSQEQAVQETAKKQGMTPEQVKQMQEQQAKVESYNKNIAAVNDKLKAATAAEQASPPNYDAAIASLNEAAQMAPNEDLVWFRLGQAYLDSAKTQSDAAEKTKRTTEAYNDLGKAIDMLKAKNSGSAAAPTAAAPAKPESTQGAPAAQPAPAQPAPAQPTPGANPGAAPAVNEKDKLKLAAYYDNFASAAARMGKADDAVNAYKQAAELDPPHAGQYYFNLGAVLTNTATDQNSKKLAAEAFDKAIAADPNRADAYYWKGTNLIALSTTDSSGKLSAPPGTVEAFQKYLELQPSGPHAAEAKQMLTALGSTVETSYGKKGAAPKKK
jgi:tetratricopeptide (TPR) repeat protein